MNWRYPAEWEPHSACWIAWPCRLELWPNYQQACQAYADVINAVAAFEPVMLIVSPQHLAHAKRLCSASNVTFLDFAVDDSWTRDTLPIFLHNGIKLAAAAWEFNAWGNKFHPYSKDAKLSSLIIDYLGVSSQKTAMILEGGSINSDGQGTLLTTKQCLLHHNRNPSMDQATIAQHLTTQLHLGKIIWLEQGIDGDIDTDGHVDNFACFIRPQEILVQACHDPDDRNYKNYRINRDILVNTTDHLGHTLIIHEVPQPPLLSYHRGHRLPLSYVNFYFANGAVIMPSFEQKPSDERALYLFKELFYNREVVQINALPIVHGGGGIHCITMQQPCPS